MQDLNFWFYTLSAIPQTLGSMIALTTAFAVFKLSKIAEEIDTHIYHLKIILRYINEGRRIEGLKDDIKNYLGLFSSVIKSNDHEWLNTHKSKLDAAYVHIVRGPTPNSWQDHEILLEYQIKQDFIEKLKRKHEILNYLISSLIITSFTILLCLILLPLPLENYRVLAISIALIFTVLSIISIFFSILKINGIVVRIWKIKI